MSSFVPEPKVVTLGRQTYKIHPLKWNRVLPLKNMLQEFAQETEKTLNVSRIIREILQGNANVGVTIDQLGQSVELLYYKASAILKLAIPELDVGIFQPDATDEECPDVVQVIEAYRTVLEVNHLGFLEALVLPRQRGTPTTTS